MRAARMVTVFLVACAAGVVVPAADALRFADSPCAEASGTSVRVCPGAVVGKPYTVVLSGEGGCGPALPYQYQLLNGSLPPGVSLSPNGHLTGTPVTAGTWQFWVRLSDQDPPTASWCRPAKSEREFRLHVAAPTATVGVPYAYALAAPGSSARTWSLVSGALPPGLTLDGARGTLGGFPAAPGVYQLAFAGTDGGGHETRTEFALTVYPRFLLATATLPPARVGRPYRTYLRTQGAVGGVRYLVTFGGFPIGLRLDPGAGVLRGKARRPGSYRFTITALDSQGRGAARKFVLTVRP